MKKLCEWCDGTGEERDNVICMNCEGTGKVESDDYNGWANYETWNVALSIQNDYALFTIAKDLFKYEEFKEIIMQTDYKKTGENIAWDNEKLDIDELDQFIKELE